MGLFLFQHVLYAVHSIKPKDTQPKMVFKEEECYKNNKEAGLVFFCFNDYKGHSVTTAESVASSKK